MGGGILALEPETESEGPSSMVRRNFFFVCSSAADKDPVVSSVLPALISVNVSLMYTLQTNRLKSSFPPSFDTARLHSCNVLDNETSVAIAPLTGSETVALDFIILLRPSWCSPLPFLGSPARNNWSLLCLYTISHTPLI